MVAYRGKWRVTTEHGTIHLFDWEWSKYTRLPMESPNKFLADGQWRRIIIRPDVLEVGEPFKMLLEGRE